MKSNKLNEIKKENKIMNKEELRTQETKQSMKIEVKVALPWTLIVFGAAIIASLIIGWNMRSGDISRVKAEAYSIVELTKTPSKQ